MRYLVLFAVLMGGLPCSALSLVLVHDSIEVDIDFDGDEIAVFAVADQADAPDVVFAIALIGPISRYRLVRRADDTEARIFYAPSVLSIAVEPGFYTRISAKARQRAGLDPVELIQPDPARLYEAPPLPIWYEALTGLKTEAGLFWIGARIRRLDGGLVRADLPLSAQSPVGEYRVRAVMFKGGEILAEAEKRLTLRRQGAEGFLYDLSRRSAIAYGLLAVLIGLLAGVGGAWLVRP